MAKYKDKWKTTFPTSIGNQTRPEDGVDNTQEYNTDGLPQYMANDPVRYDLQNAVNSQLVSNDERLNEKISRTSDDLAAHNKDPKAHATGIAGNAATASKLITPRTISLTGKASGSTSFDGSSNASINVTSVNADTASKLSTARKINITGNATGAAAFDGSGDANISVTVNESKHAAAADKATKDGNGADIAATYLKKAGDTATGDIIAPNFVGFLKGNADTATTAAACTGNSATATKLATARSISITGNATGAAVLFDGSKDISINVTDVVLANKATADGAGNNIVDTYVPKTGAGASGSWGIDISGIAADADKLDGYHAQDILDKITAANVGGIIAESLTANGYVKFANGLIIQWGVVGWGGVGFNGVTFPIAFPDACFAVITSYLKNDRVGDYRAVGWASKTGCGIATDNCAAYWLAIGI